MCARLGFALLFNTSHWMFDLYDNMMSVCFGSQETNCKNKTMVKQLMSNSLRCCACHIKSLGSKKSWWKIVVWTWCLGQLPVFCFPFFCELFRADFEPSNPGHSRYSVAFFHLFFTQEFWVEATFSSFF